MRILLGILAIVGILIVVIAVIAFLVSLVVRDRKHGTSGSLSSAMLEMESLVDPGKKKVVQAMRHAGERTDEDDSGDGDPDDGPA